MDPVMDDRVMEASAGWDMKTGNKISQRGLKVVIPATPVTRETITELATAVA